ERQILDAGRGQLKPHEPGNRGADGAGEEREDQIEGADVLVVGGHEPAREEGRPMLVPPLLPRQIPERACTCYGPGHARLLGFYRRRSSAWITARQSRGQYSA